MLISLISKFKTLILTIQIFHRILKLYTLTEKIMWQPLKILARKIEKKTLLTKTGLNLGHLDYKNAANI